MARKTRPKTLVEVQNELTSALRRTSVRPSIFGYRAQPHQELFHKSEARGRLFIGGNRSGKTVGGAAEMVQWMTNRSPHSTKFPAPVRCRGIAVDFDNGVEKIMKPEIARWIPPSMLINGSWEDSYQRALRTLTLSNGSFLEFMSYDQDVDKFAGTSRHCIWFDEEPPEDIFNENMLRLVDTGGHWWLTMTPVIEMSWTFDRLYEAGTNGKDPNVEVFEVETAQNEYINEMELQVLTAGLSDAERDARLKGKYISFSGTIFKDTFSPDRNIIPPILDSDVWPIYHSKWAHFAMLDHGFNNPTALLLGCYDQEGRIVIYDEYYVTQTIIKDHAANFKRLFAQHKIQPEYIVADPSIRNRDPITGTSIQQEYAEHGIYTTLGNNDVRAGISRVSSRFLTGNLLITKNCHNLLWEINRYKWDKYANKKMDVKRNAKESPLKKDDHACDALRYGVASRPAMLFEEEMRKTNFLDAPVAIGAERIDTELHDLLERANYGGEFAPYDDVLGTDW